MYRLTLLVFGFPSIHVPIYQVHQKSIEKKIIILTIRPGSHFLDNIYKSKSKKTKK